MPNPENLIGHGFDKHPERINRKGNPGSKWLSTILKDHLSKEGRDLKLITTLVKKAIEDEDLNAIKEIIDRLEGKSVQTVNTDVTVSQGILNIDPLNDSGDNEPKKDSSAS